MSTQASSRQQRLLLRIRVDDPGGAWREIAVDGRMSLAQLGDAIIITFGWTGIGRRRFGCASPINAASVPSWPDSARSDDGGEYQGGTCTKGADGDHEYGSGSRSATPTLNALRPRHPVPQEWRNADEYYDYDYDYDYDRFNALDALVSEREWCVEDALHHFGSSLCFEYTLLNPTSIRGGGMTRSTHGGQPTPAPMASPVRTTIDTSTAFPRLHHIAIVEQFAGVNSDAPVLYCGGEGTVDRTASEAVYGELGDPNWLSVINAELFVRFAGDVGTPERFEAPGFSLQVLRALRGSTLTARRALRIDARLARIFDPIEVRSVDIDTMTAAVRDTLARASHGAGIPRETADELADDLRSIGFLRTVRGHLVTKVAARRYITDPGALWMELASRLMSHGSATRWDTRLPLDLVALVIDLARERQPVRAIAIAEAAEAQGGLFPGDPGGQSIEFQRVLRILDRTGALDSEGRPCTPEPGHSLAP